MILGAGAVAYWQVERVGGKGVGVCFMMCLSVYMHVLNKHVSSVGVPFLRKFSHSRGGRRRVWLLTRMCFHGFEPCATQSERKCVNLWSGFKLELHRGGPLVMISVVMQSMGCQTGVMGSVAIEKSEWKKGKWKMINIQYLTGSTVKHWICNKTKIGVDFTSLIWKTYV